MSLPKPATPHLDPTHAFNLTAVAVLALTEGTGQPAIIQGPHGGSAPTTTSWNGTPAVWITNGQGAGLRFTSGVSGQLRLGTGGLWLPTGDCTLLLVRGKLDATLAVAYFFNSGASGTATFGMYLPYGDGTLYWDYGGDGAPNRLTKAGLTYSTSTIDLWVFTAGAAGSAVWQNGVKHATQATGITRTNNAAIPTVAYAGENEDVNFVQINDSQWDDATIAAWFLNPYAGLYTPTETVGTATGTATVLGVGGYRTTGEKRSGFGAQKPSRRRRHR